MEFKLQAFIDREIEIAGYLQQDLSFKQISKKTGLSKRHLSAHLHNMMEKLDVSDIEGIKKLLKEKGL
jgi:DNA-binding CsgD family transcriptional regulator